MNKKDMKTLANKVIVITGASSGIGEAMAKVYAAQGAKVVLGARNVQKLQLLAGDIRARGGQAAYCGVDVTKPEECRELIETAVREFGGIDVLICNAGISMRAIFDGVAPCCFPSAVRAEKRTFEAVKPGQAIITCNPFLRFSIRSVSRNPVMAYFEAE